MSADRDSFNRERDAFFDAVIRFIEGRDKAATLDDLRVNAEKDCWSLLLSGIRHLKNGAPAAQPGAMSEALTKASLRSSSLAATLGVRPPQFEPVLLPADYSNGREAALFLCGKLAEAAAADFPKSRQRVQQAILQEKAPEDLKRQMAMSCDVLAETYARVCSEFKAALSEI